MLDRFLKKYGYDFQFGCLAQAVLNTNFQGGVAWPFWLTAFKKYCFVLHFLVFTLHILRDKPQIKSKK
jgi:hypothetical protein